MDVYSGLTKHNFQLHSQLSKEHLIRQHVFTKQWWHSRKEGPLVIGRKKRLCISCGFRLVGDDKELHMLCSCEQWTGSRFHVRT